MCFSFSFETNKTNLNKYIIYYSIDDYKDDKAFQNLNEGASFFPRKKNNKYTFYYELYLL